MFRNAEQGHGAARQREDLHGTAKLYKPHSRLVVGLSLLKTVKAGESAGLLFMATRATEKSCVVETELLA